MSDRKVGEGNGGEPKKKKSASKSSPRKRPSQRGSDIGRALRSVYDETLRENVPDDLRDLLGKLS